MLIFLEQTGKKNDSFPIHPRNIRGIDNLKVEIYLVGSLFRKMQKIVLIIQQNQM